MRNIVVDICRRDDDSGRYNVYVNNKLIGETGTKWGARRIAKRYIKNSFCERITYYRKELPKENRMKRFYVNEDTQEILNEDDYNKSPEGNYRLLGEFIDKSQARRNYYITQPKEDENK